MLLKMTECRLSSYEPSEHPGGFVGMMGSKRSRLAPLAGIFLLIASLFAFESANAAYEPGTLAERLTPDLVERVYPGAERLGPEEGTPPSIAVYQGDEVVGYLLSTLDVVAARGYSGVAFDIIVGVNLDGIVTGAEILYQSEPLIRGDEARQARLDVFLAALAGTNRTDRGGYAPDFMSGVTISARSMRVAVWDAANAVLRANGGLPIVTEPMIDVGYFAPMTADELVALGALSRATVTNGEIAALLEAEAGPGATLDVKIGDDPEAAYIDLFVGLAMPALVGRNVFGPVRYDRLFDGAPQTSILFASVGPFNPRGIAYLNASSGYQMDRLRVVQGDIELTFIKDQFQRISGTRNLIPDARETGVLSIEEETGFDPLLPWQLELLAHGVDASGEPITLVIPVDGGPSEAFILRPEPPPPPVWVEAWTDARVDLIILGSALLVLTFLLLFQHQFARFRRFHRWTRNGFLLFTLVWLGWIAGGQLSTLHLMTYAKAPFEGFGLGFYLAEPLIVVLAVYVLFSLILLGRGVFCGWLCPFGALQELLAKIAWCLRIPRWNPSDRVQSKAWIGKYLSAAGLIIVAIGWPEASPIAAEVEPFKTAITAMFSRPLPYVGFAVFLLGIGLITERAYCRFLCPLGGMLAVLDRLHIFNVLKRRPECGATCQLCERSCPVKAIRPSGEIVMAECFQCLDCQVEYYDDRRCPPLAKQRKQRARSATRQPPMGSPVPAYARVSTPVYGADK